MRSVADIKSDIRAYLRYPYYYVANIPRVHQMLPIKIQTHKEGVLVVAASSEQFSVQTRHFVNLPQIIGF
ncbi:MAG: hypothetical protein EA414_19890 [Arthrospira sp. PLM2.Bin9]|nr:MAG: hypothetical protein EA414_19890 [Arthrospira sp. PLM2.Bin9]